MSEHNINNFKSLIKQKRVVKKVPKGALLAMGVPNKGSVSEYSPAGILMGDLLKEVGVSLPPVSTKDTAIMDNVAFVTPSGDNSTGTIGDMNKPYKTVAAAINAGVETVILLPGTYTELVRMDSNQIFYCMPGVEFASGGVSMATGGIVTNARWLGHANFKKSAKIEGVADYFDDIYIEFNEMDQTSNTVSNYFKPLDDTQPCGVTIKCNKLKATAGQNGSALAFKYKTNFHIEIAGEVTSLGNVVGCFTYSGQGYIKFKKAILHDSGAALDWYRGFLSSQVMASGDNKITIIGDIRVGSGVTQVGTAGVFAGNSPSLSVIHKGNIDANGLTLVGGYGAASGTIELEGNYIGNNKICTLTGSANLIARNSFFSFGTTGTTASTGKVKFDNCEFEDGNLNQLNMSPSVNSYLFKNCTFYNITTAMLIGVTSPSNISFIDCLAYQAFDANLANNLSQGLIIDTNIANI